MTVQEPTPEEKEPYEVVETVDFSTTTVNQEKPQESNPQLIEIRKLIETYVKEEIRKIQNTTEEQQVARPTIERQRSIKSGSGKPTKPHTPK